MATVQMNASAIGGTLQLSFSGTVVVPTSGIITVDARDAIDLLRIGAKYANSVQRAGYFQTPRNGTAGRFVASTSLANGTLSIANQPDVPRQGQIVVGNGAGAGVTAGNVAVTYTANDSTTQVDNFSAVVGSSVTATSATSKGVVAITSVIVTGISGGTSPFVYFSDTNALAMTVDPGFSSFMLVRESVDDTLETGGATVASGAACVAPSTAPNGTHDFNMAATWVY